MKDKLHIYIMCLLCMMFCVSCSDSDGDSLDEKSGETLTILIAAPQTNVTRAGMGDPGSDTGEGNDWDQLAVILTYTEIENYTPGLSYIIVKTLSKGEFERLPVYTGTTYRQLQLNVVKGKANIYGLTYSNGAEAELEAAINDWETAIVESANAAKTKVQGVTISNNYASTLDNSTAKFLSVATGYYKDIETGVLAEYDISSKSPVEGELQPRGIPSMQLIRLAAKIDIQWDAQDAYSPGGYTNVKVENFKYDGGAVFGDDATEAGKKGRGRLFPGLNTSSTVLGGSATFINQTEISKRNGRVYHYVFPDGASTPKITFNLSGTKNEDGKITDTPTTYTFNFPTDSILKQATWYKVNTTIRGLNGTTTITLSQ